MQRWPLAPYLDELDANFAKDHEEIVMGLELPHEPLVRNLHDVQRSLNETTVAGRLSTPGLGIAIATLEIATRLRYDPQDLRIPDTTGTLRELGDIVHGDPLSTGDIPDFNFTHPEISNDLARHVHLDILETLIYTFKSSTKPLFAFRNVESDSSLAFIHPPS